tara:strand:- start:644 stop:1057 length:414 start_codon:yes stop_codon:yes gene_type:complete
MTVEKKNPTDYEVKQALMSLLDASVSFNTELRAAVTTLTDRHLAYLKSKRYEDANVWSGETVEEPKLLAGISEGKVALAAMFLKTGFKSPRQIANHLGLKSPQTVIQKVLPNVRKLHNVARVRMGARGKYKYKIASR